VKEYSREIRIFIHAPNVHQGGGAALLIELLRAASRLDTVSITIDARMVLPNDLSLMNVTRVSPTLFSRLQAEWRLAKAVQLNDIVLCFGNLPPFFKLGGKATVFLQNRYLVDWSPSFTDLPLKVKARLLVERFWLYWRRKNAESYFVQTPSMERLTKARLGVRVRSFAFVPEVFSPISTLTEERKKVEYDFLYVASGEPHKNHKVLVEAWRNLAEEGIFPSLALTLSLHDAPQLLNEINQISTVEGLRVHNLGIISREKLLVLYGQVGAIIYPSEFESFGLPLLEATAAGLPILAAELDYVRDVIDPVESFNPKSPISIARAVKRYMGLKERVAPIKTAKEFLQHCIDEEKN